MKLLDLFCGAGGAAMGYSRAGFDEIVGVDVVPQKNYPFTFIQGDALQPPVRLEDFDLIHASPPCQRFSPMTLRPNNWPDLVDSTRRLLAGFKSVIENVSQAPLRRDVLLCGSMFGLDIRRHRVFELGGWSSFSAGGCNHKGWQGGRPWTITGNNGGSINPQTAHSWKYRDADHAAALLGMPPGMPQRSYTEAIPPAFTEYLGTQFLDQLARQG